MSDLLARGILRRRFLAAAGGAVAAWSVGAARGQEPALDDGGEFQPRATSGDPIGPSWEERLTVTVGPKEADIVGSGQRALQAAVDYVAGLGGGTVRILPGTYTLRNAVYLRSGVRIVGAGEETLLIKAPSVKSTLAADSDWYDQEITLTDATGFELGDGVCLQTVNPHNGARDVCKRTLVARNGNRFKLDRALRQNFWTVGQTTVSTLFPLLSGEEIADIEIESLVLDGNKENNELLDGNYAGCIFLQDCNRIGIREVEARNYRGDGISWQICHDVVVARSYSHDNTGLGMHPGSGSQRPSMEDNRVERNDIGIFFCWGVKRGVAQRNQLRENRCGISIGHRDTDNLIAENVIAGSREVGLLFRPERGHAFAPHRNRVERNTLSDNGPDAGVAIDIQGEVENVALVGNTLTEDRAAMQRVGIRIGAQSKGIELTDNEIRGFATAVEDLRTA